MCVAQGELYYKKSPGAQQCGLKKRERETERETGRLKTEDLVVQLLLSCYLSCSGLLSVGSFLTFKFLFPPMSPNLATRLCSCLFFFFLLCGTPLWTGPIERIAASSSLHPSLQSSSEASGLEKKQRGDKGGGSANHGGVKGEPTAGRGCMRGWLGQS